MKHDGFRLWGGRHVCLDVAISLDCQLFFKYVRRSCVLVGLLHFDEYTHTQISSCIERIYLLLIVRYYWLLFSVRACCIDGNVKTGHYRPLFCKHIDNNAKQTNRSLGNEFDVYARRAITVPQRGFDYSGHQERTARAKNV